MKVAFWTTCCLEPRIEAVSKEVFRLSSAFPGSWVFGVNRSYIARFSLRHRYAGAHAAMYPALRATIPAIERCFDVSHVYGDMTPWLFHKALRARPLIHTITQDSPDATLAFLQRCVAIVTQTEATRDRVLASGVDAHRVHLRRPGIDLSQFRSDGRRTPPGRSPRVLFSTAPRTDAELRDRGVLLVLETARRTPDVHFDLLFRPWSSGYTSLDAVRRTIGHAPPRNVLLINEFVPDMSSVYVQHDFTVIPFTTRHGGKECPNSAIESLACGIPVLVSTACPFARFVEDNACGVTFDPTPEHLREAIQKGLASWGDLAAAARRAAAEHFNDATLFTFYNALYQRRDLPQTSRSPCSA